MQIIKNWLTGSKNFIVGATLYRSFGRNEQFKKLLDKGETVFAKNLLAEELEKMIAPGANLLAPAAKESAPEADKETAAMPDDADEILQAIKNEWLPLFQNMNLLRHELDKFGNRNDWEAIAWRKPRAREIKALEKQCNAIWAKRDYYLKHKKLPFVQEKQIDIPKDPIKLGRRIEATKKNIRRNRNIAQQEGADPKFTKLYQDYKEEYKLLTGDEYEEKN